jgi:hypothetical protein
MRRKSKPRVIGRGKARKAQWAKGLEALALTAKLEERFGVSHEVQCARCDLNQCIGCGADAKEIAETDRFMFVEWAWRPNAYQIGSVERLATICVNCQTDEEREDTVQAAEELERRDSKDQS